MEIIKEASEYNSHTILRLTIGGMMCILRALDKLSNNKYSLNLVRDELKIQFENAVRKYPQPEILNNVDNYHYKQLTGKVIVNQNKDFITLNDGTKYYIKEFHG